MTRRPSHCALFDGISAEDCGAMFDCFGAREESYKAGRLICEFDGKQDSVGILLSGCAELLRLDIDGNRTLLETLDEGGVFGEVLAFSGASGDSTFLECRKDCRVLYLRYDQITKRCENACARHSQLVQNFMRLLSAKTLTLSRRVEVLSRRSIREKLLCYFEQQLPAHSLIFAIHTFGNKLRGTILTHKAGLFLSR